MQLIHNIFPAAAMTVAPLTGDKGYDSIILIAVVGVVLVGAFVALSVLQKKRRAQNDESDE